MTYATVVCLDDLIRIKFWPAKAFIYDLIRAPVWFAAGKDIAKSPRFGERSNLLAGFDHQRFLELCGQGHQAPDWAELYHSVPGSAAAYLRAYIPVDALVISYEMPPWLLAVLNATGNDWIDLRVSPLRFASDLYIAARTNSPALYGALKRHAQTESAIHFEAMLLTAQIRHRLRYDAAPTIEGALVYIGQTETDAAIVNSQGCFARINDFNAVLQAAAGESPVFYRAHPDSGEFADREHRTLEDILGRPVQRCDYETYDLMAGDANTRLIGLSSGALQEAQWFGREATALFGPVCTPTFDSNFDPNGYLQLASHDFVSEPLWADLLGAPPRIGAVRLAPRPNMLRELHNAWWGYASLQIRYAHFYRTVMDIHGGELRDQQQETQQQLEQVQREVIELRDQLRKIQALSTRRIGSV